MGAGELHLDVATSRLARESGLPLVKSEPVVTMRETIVGPSERTYLGKSSNKHNRIFAVSCFELKQAFSNFVKVFSIFFLQFLCIFRNLFSLPVSIFPRPFSLFP